MVSEGTIFKEKLTTTDDGDQVMQISHPPAYGRPGELIKFELKQFLTDMRKSKEVKSCPSTLSTFSD